MRSALTTAETNKRVGKHQPSHTPSNSPDDQTLVSGLNRIGPLSLELRGSNTQRKDFVHAHPLAKIEERALSIKA